MEDLFKHYKALELEPGADPKHIHEAYIRLMKVWDPELHISNPILMAKAKERRADIEAAFEAFRLTFTELDRLGKERPKEEVLPTNASAINKKTRLDVSKVVLSILVLVFIAAVFWSSQQLLTRGREKLPAPSNPDAIADSDMPPASDQAAPPSQASTPGQPAKPDTPDIP